jgi:chromosome segregation ATPase
MQTQIHQLGEARKQDRDQVASWLLRIEELEQRTLTWQAQIREGEERHRSLASQFDGLYSTDEVVRAEVRKINEELQIEKQSLRRQAVEAQQLVADVRSILDDHHSRIGRLDEIRQQIELFTEQLPAQIVDIENKLPEITNEIKRVERVSTERFLMNQERLEEVRHQQDDKVVALQETDEQHLRQQTAWLERLDGWVRELEQRLARAVSRVDLTQREHTAQLNGLEQRDMQLIEALTATLGEQLQKIKAEQVEQGREAPEKTG